MSHNNMSNINSNNLMNNNNLNNSQLQQQQQQEPPQNENENHFIGNILAEDNSDSDLDDGKPVTVGQASSSSGGAPSSIGISGGARDGAGGGGQPQFVGGKLGFGGPLGLGANTDYGGAFNNSGIPDRVGSATNTDMTAKYFTHDSPQGKKLTNPFGGTGGPNPSQLTGTPFANLFGQSSDLQFGGSASLDPLIRRPSGMGLDPVFSGSQSMAESQKQQYQASNFDTMGLQLNLHQLLQPLQVASGQNIPQNLGGQQQNVDQNSGSAPNLQSLIDSYNPSGGDNNQEFYKSKEYYEYYHAIKDSRDARLPMPQYKPDMDQQKPTQGQTDEIEQKLNQLSLAASTDSQPPLGGHMSFQGFKNQVPSSGSGGLTPNSLGQVDNFHHQYQQLLAQQQNAQMHYTQANQQQLAALPSQGNVQQYQPKQNALTNQGPSSATTSHNAGGNGKGKKGKGSKGGTQNSGVTTSSAIQEPPPMPKPPTKPNPPTQNLQQVPNNNSAFSVQGAHPNNNLSRVAGSNYSQGQQISQGVPSQQQHTFNQANQLNQQRGYGNWGASAQNQQSVAGANTALNPLSLLTGGTNNSALSQGQNAANLMQMSAFNSQLGASPNIGVQGNSASLFNAGLFGNSLSGAQGSNSQALLNQGPSGFYNQSGQTDPSLMMQNYAMSMGIQNPQYAMMMQQMVNNMLRGGSGTQSIPPQLYPSNNAGGSFLGNNPFGQPNQLGYGGSLGGQGYNQGNPLGANPMTGAGFGGLNLGNFNQFGGSSANFGGGNLNNSNLSNPGNGPTNMGQLDSSSGGAQYQKKGFDNQGQNYNQSPQQFQGGQMSRGGSSQNQSSRGGNSRGGNQYSHNSGGSNHNQTGHNNNSRSGAGNYGGGRGGNSNGVDRNYDQSNKYYQVSGSSQSMQRENSSNYQYGMNPSADLSQNMTIQQAKSEFLEDLRNKIQNSKKIEIKEIKDHVVECSMDQYGSRFIQQKYDVTTEEEKDLIFSEILPEANILMNDVFGNYVVQKLFEYGTDAQIATLAEQLLGNILKLTKSMYGCRVVQKALEVITQDQQRLLVQELKDSVLECIYDQNGNHVIQKCIEKMPNDSVDFIVQAVSEQTQIVSDLCLHTYGCRVIQRILENCEDRQTKPIIDHILADIQSLTKDQFGNYVIQHILENGRNQEDKSRIVKSIKGRVIELSNHKFASNVVEKCLQHGSEKDRKEIIDEFLESNYELAEEINNLNAGGPQLNGALYTMMKDRYGNYVIQKCIEVSKGKQREVLIKKITACANVLRKQANYSRHVYNFIEKFSPIDNSNPPNEGAIGAQPEGGGQHSSGTNSSHYHGGGKSRGGANMNTYGNNYVDNSTGYQNQNISHGGYGNTGNVRANGSNQSQNQNHHYVQKKSTNNANNSGSGNQGGSNKKK